MYFGVTRGNQKSFALAQIPKRERESVLMRKHSPHPVCMYGYIRSIYFFAKNSRHNPNGR